MSVSVRIALNVAKPIFLKIYALTYPGNKLEQICGIHYNSYATAQSKQSPIGKKSPSLVTLILTHIGTNLK
jgi:hypothetical protein